MGLNCYSRIVVGVPVERAALVPDRRPRWECSCGHVWHEPPPKFCPSCGAKVPTNLPAPPMTAFERWLGHAVEEYDNEARDGRGMFEVSAVSDYEAKTRHYALGVCLGRTESHQYGQSRAPSGSDEAAIAAAFNEARGIAAACGIEGEPRLYLTTIVSY